MSEKNSSDTPERDPVEKAPEEEQKPTQSGPVFTKSPDPLSGVRKVTDKAWKSTEGKTVSMRVYIGSIIGVIVLMLVAQCSG